MESSSKKAFGGLGIVAALLFIVSGLMIAVAGKPFGDDDCKTAMYILAASGALAIVYAIGIVLEKRSMVLTVCGVFLAVTGLIAICIPFVKTDGVAIFCAFGIFALLSIVTNVLSDWADQVKGAMYVNSLLAAIVLFAVIMTFVKGDYIYELIIPVAFGIWLIVASYIGAFVPAASGTRTRVVVEDAVSQKKSEKPKARNNKATKKAKKPEPKKEEPKAEEPKKEEPKAEEPKKEEPKAEEPKKEEPKAEEPKKEEPKAEEPKEEPKKEMTKDESMKDFMSRLVSSKDANNASRKVEEPAEEPAKIEPAEEPAKIEPAEEPAKIEPAEEPAKIEPAEEQPKLEPAEEPAKIEPAEEPAKIEPAEEPAKIEPAEEQPKLEPAEEPAKIEPAEEPAKIEPAEEPAVAAAVAGAAAAVAMAEGEDEDDDEELGEDIYTDNSPEALVRRAAWNKGLRCRREYGDLNVPVAFVKGKVAVYVTDDPVPADAKAKLEEDGWSVLHYRASDITDGLEQGEEIAAQVKANMRAAKAAKKKKSAKKRSFPKKGGQSPLPFCSWARRVRAYVIYRQSMGEPEATTCSVHVVR